MKTHAKAAPRRKTASPTPKVGGTDRHRPKSVRASRKKTIKASAPGSESTVKSGRQEDPMEAAEELYRNTGKSADEDSTGGDDADDKDLPNLGNDKTDSTSRKRDTEERFSAEQQAADDDRARSR